MIIGIFARANHPRGWGTEFGAHGYVLAVVRCIDREQLKKVADRLASWPHGLKWFGRNDEWYSGQMDLVSIIDNLAFSIQLSKEPSILDGGGNDLRSEYKWQSIGDNRACAFLDAGDIIGV